MKIVPVWLRLSLTLTGAWVDPLPEGWCHPIDGAVRDPRGDFIRPKCSSDLRGRRNDCRLPSEVAMMDQADVARDPMSIGFPERTVRIGAAHGDSQSIGLLFSRPHRPQPVSETPTLDALPAMAFSQETAALEARVEHHPPATWLDAMTAHRDQAGAERSSDFHADDNGLYRMYLPATI